MSLLSGMGIALFPYGLALMIGCVVLGVRLYRRRHSSALAISQGAKIGAFLGFFGSVFYSIFLLVSFSVDGSQMREAARDTMTAAVQRAASESHDPRTQEQFQQMSHWLASSEGFWTFVAIAMIFYLVALVLLAGVTGAVSAAFLEKTRQ